MVVEEEVVVGLAMRETKAACLMRRLSVLVERKASVTAESGRWTLRGRSGLARRSADLRRRGLRLVGAVGAIFYLSFFVVLLLDETGVGLGDAGDCVCMFWVSRDCVRMWWMEESLVEKASQAPPKSFEGPWEKSLIAENLGKGR